MFTLSDPDVISGESKSLLSLGFIDFITGKNKVQGFPQLGFLAAHPGEAVQVNK